jgi:hypothetical protein
MNLAFQKTRELCGQTCNCGLSTTDSRAACGEWNYKRTMQKHGSEIWSGFIVKLRNCFVTVASMSRVTLDTSLIPDRKDLPLWLKLTYIIAWHHKFIVGILKLDLSCKLVAFTVCCYLPFFRKNNKLIQRSVFKSRRDVLLQIIRFGVNMT